MSSKGTRGAKATLKAIDGGLKGIPKPPDSIPDDRVPEWNTIAAELVERKLLTASMLGVLETYIVALWTVRECQKAIAEHGLLVTTAHQMMKPNPASGIMAKSMETVARLSAELGLTPKSAPMVTMRTTMNWDALKPTERQYQARLMEVYAGMASAMDHEVGRLMAHLKSTGEFDNTVFVFLSDNGPEGSDYKEADIWLSFHYNRDLDRLGSKGAYVVPGPSWSSASASPLSTFKFYAGEGGIRSPLIISGAPGTASNQIHAGLTHVTDILPTLLDLAKVPRPGPSYQGQSIEPPIGRSLLPVLSNPALRVRTDDEPVGYELAGNKALFKGDLKLVLNTAPIGDGQWHLYDLRTDPGETKDLRQQRPQEFAAMQADYAAWATAQGVLPMPEGYNPVRQVMINTVFNYWIPAYRNSTIIALAGMVGAGWFLIARRRRARTG